MSEALHKLLVKFSVLNFPQATLLSEKHKELLLKNFTILLEISSLSLDFFSGIPCKSTFYKDLLLFNSRINFKFTKFFPKQTQNTSLWNNPSKNVNFSLPTLFSTLKIPTQSIHHPSLFSPRNSQVKLICINRVLHKIFIDKTYFSLFQKISFQILFLYFVSPT